MNPTRKPALLPFLTLSVVFGLLTGLPADAETASALLREGDPFPGFSEVTAIIQPAVNHVGGFSLTINTNESGNTVSEIVELLDRSSPIRQQRVPMQITPQQKISSAIVPDTNRIANRAALSINNGDAKSSRRFRNDTFETMHALV